MPMTQPANCTNEQVRISRLNDRHIQTFVKGINVDIFLHDLAFDWAGAERVLEALCHLNESAPVVAVAGDEQLMKKHLKNHSVSCLFPHISSNFQARAATPLISLLLPRRHRYNDRLTVSSYAMARWLPSANPRLVYCHSPMRQIWHGRDVYETQHSAEALSLRLLGQHLRNVDLRATRSDDLVLVPSPRVADLVAQTYGHPPSLIVPPPVDATFFDVEMSEAEDYFVWVGRIVEPIKRLTVLLSTFTQCPNQRLLVVGDGRSRQQMEKLAPSNVEFLGWRSGEDQRRLIMNAQALLLPSMEDFGMVAAESMALGTPVIATRLAGSAHWLRAGVDGLIVGPNVHDFVIAIEQFKRPDFAGGPEIRNQAMSFHPARFHEQLEYVTGVLGWR
jgi:glycosyltransferase involved in cell wall biosynthesis